MCDSTHFGVPDMCSLCRVQHGIRAGLSCFRFISSSKLILQVLFAMPTGIDVVYNFAEGSFLKFCTDFETSLVADWIAICKAAFVFCFQFISSSKLILQVMPACPTGIDVVYNFAKGSFLKFCTDFETSLADCADICKAAFVFCFQFISSSKLILQAARETSRN